VGLAIGAVAGIAGGILVGVLGGDDGDEREPDAVLDDPGVATEPGVGIPVGTDVTGEQVPSIELEALEGATVDLGELGGSPAVLNFWFSACAPCVREMPAFEEAHTRLQDDVRIIGINPIDSVEAATDFAERVGVTYELVRYPDGEAISALGVAGYPTTVFVSADGTVLRQKAGELSADEIVDLSAEMFGVGATA
jgi:peroxiredoxin